MGAGILFVESITAALAARVALALTVTVCILDKEQAGCFLATTCNKRACMMQLEQGNKVNSQNQMRGQG